MLSMPQYRNNILNANCLNYNREEGGIEGDSKHIFALCQLAHCSDNNKVTTIFTV